MGSNPLGSGGAVSPCINAAATAADTLAVPCRTAADAARWLLLRLSRLPADTARHDAEAALPTAESCVWLIPPSAVCGRTALLSLPTFPPSAGENGSGCDVGASTPLAEVSAAERASLSPAGFGADTGRGTTCFGVPAASNGCANACSSSGCANGPVTPAPAGRFGDADAASDAMAALLSSTTLSEGACGRLRPWPVSFNR